MVTHSNDIRKHSHNQNYVIYDDLDTGGAVMLHVMEAAILGKVTHFKVVWEMADVVLQALWIPAPVFCCMMQVTMYLKGFWSLSRLRMQPSMIRLHQPLTFSLLYLTFTPSGPASFKPNTFEIAY